MTRGEPAGGAGGLEPALPSSWYRSEPVFALEKERIFFREWLCVGREEELPQPGSHKLFDVLGQSILAVRNRENELHAFYNVCRHRGARLCKPDEGEGCGGPSAIAPGIAGSRIVCPYHQWSYDFNGRLIAAPHVSGLPGFDRTQFALYPAGVETWGGFLFLNLTPATAVPLRQQIAGIPGRVARYPLETLRIGHTIEYQVAANWKVICENYNECYHCAGVHPELCAIVPAFREGGGANLDWNRGVPHREGAYTFTTTGTTRRRPFPGLDEDEKVRHKGEVLYPNLFVSLACDHAAVFILKPRGVARTDITCHFLFEPHELAKADFDASDTSQFWDLVNRQDWEICEAVQEGMGARVHERGYYAPMEDYNLDIRRYLLDRIGDAVTLP